ncbi:IucA/IucC family siderophore biosynthesis protein [Frankia sp. AgB32]|uniref:IucA/IucC family protein n=1 Tax=Frankia sp. AgB32 TaxID=631119 RepID=UPI00200BAA86|nr:IucA/IucC family protein [Frankia sp. AgB32]MCK9893069.1 IucA/IucC family protein [Frankia sp. AgB32]
MTSPPPAATAPGDPGTPGASAAGWRSAGQALLVRLIAELAYEDLLHPEVLDQQAGTDGVDDPPIGRGPARTYALAAAGCTYVFRARRGTFGSWWIEPSTLVRTSSPSNPAVDDRRADGPADHREDHAGLGEDAADDPVRFLWDVQPQLGWSDQVLADVIRDLLATQAADRHLLESAIPAADLADLPFVALEGRQAGHPCLVANKGRLGFGAQTDLYSPEARTPFRLRWVAAHPTIGLFRQIGSVTATRAEHPAPAGAETVAMIDSDLLTTELDEGTRARFADVLTHALGTGAIDTTAEDYVWLPVHPWQWANVIVPLFAAELATGQLVPLGEAPDRYVPLQAVRTLANVDVPSRRNVKLSLMIRNTLVWRGMSAADAVAGPAVSSWLLGVRTSDAFLREATRVTPLPEVAGATVRHPAYDRIPAAPYRLHELLGVLWRDPVDQHLDPGEQARSLASLLLVGSDGRALVTELVARSGQPAQDWLTALFSALLPPLLHYLYRYGIAFTPHGENVLCVFAADQLPSRIAIKDFGADIELVDGDFPEREPLPPAVAEHCRRWPGAMLAHSVLSAVFAGHFRFFSVLVEDHLEIAESEFWRLVRATVDSYHARFPELRRRFHQIDLLVPRFDRVCLNREQFAGAGFHDRAERDGGFDLTSGSVANPVAAPPGDPTGPGPDRGAPASRPETG